MPKVASNNLSHVPTMVTWIYILLIMIMIIMTMILMMVIIITINIMTTIIVNILRGDHDYDVGDDHDHHIPTCSLHMVITC